MWQREGNISLASVTRLHRNVDKLNEQATMAAIGGGREERDLLHSFVFSRKRTFVIPAKWNLFLRVHYAAIRNGFILKYSGQLPSQAARRALTFPCLYEYCALRGGRRAEKRRRGNGEAEAAQRRVCTARSFHSRSI